MRVDFFFSVYLIVFAIFKEDAGTEAENSRFL